MLVLTSEGARMTGGRDDKLTAAAHLAAILSIDLRPSGKLEGTIRDGVHFYRFSGLKGLPGAVLRWVADEVGHPLEADLETGRADDESDPSRRSAAGEDPCR